MVQALHAVQVRLRRPKGAIMKRCVSRRPWPRVIAALAIVAGSKATVAGPDEAALIRDWCAPFVTTCGVDIQWRYELVRQATGAPGAVHRERLVASWDTGWRLEIGAGIRALPGTAVEGPTDRTAQITVNDPTQGHVSVSWTPGSHAHPALDRAPVPLADEQCSRLFLSEYLIANYLMAGISVTDMDEAEWTDGGLEKELKLALPRHEFEWKSDGAQLLLSGFVAKDDRGGIAFRQEFEEHIQEPTLGARVASRRLMFVGSEDGGIELQHVNTAILEQVSFLAEPREGLTSLDTSEATVVDLTDGVVLDHTGKEVGRILGPSPRASSRRWASLFGLAGIGLSVGGAVWWWMRRRGSG